MARDRFHTITIKPSDGGQLVTRASGENAGLPHYTTKRDFRRDLDQETRREGHDYFYPNVTKEIGGQPFPGQLVLDSITRSGGTATATYDRGHHYEVGETLILSGADQSAYNGSKPVVSVTDTTFTFAVTGTPVTPATGTLRAAPDERINLVHKAVRPNGKTAVIAGSARRLYRYFSLEDGAYYEGNNTVDEYFYGDPDDDPNNAGGGNDSDAPYYEDNPGEWIVIGWGFSTLGRRWEAVNINGYAVFNNGVDLPVTYRVEEFATVPICELREQGIAAVGTIAEYNGVLICMDILQIRESKVPALFAFDGDISSGDVRAEQPNNILTTFSDFFDATMVGKYVIYEGGHSAKVTAYTSPRHITVNGAAAGIVAPGQAFTLRTKASQNGSDFSSLITGDLATGGITVTASSGIFVVGDVGRVLRFSNGYEKVIVTYHSATSVDLAGPGPAGSITGLPFWLITPASDYLVTSESAFFTSDMKGLHLVWDSGEVRKIVSVNSSTQVEVESDLAIPSGFIGVENPDTYAAYTESAYIDRVQFRVLWSMLDEPRRFSAVVPGSIAAGSKILTLDYPIKSFENGQEIRILGAGQDGGNLTTTIAYISALGKIIFVNDVALTAVTSAPVQASDAEASIVGYQDIQDDGSGIIKALELSDTLVIYKDTAIFLMRYTGSADTPFAFQRIRVPNGKTIYYRNTLVGVGAEWHLYAGQNSFYRFDLTSRKPQEIPLFEAASDTFFDQATLANTEEIYAADNEITKEILIAFPSAYDDDLALVYDMKQETLSTTSAAITAAATVKRPESALSVGVTQNWFVMGTAHGAVLIYGRTDENEIIPALPDWNEARAIYFRRDLNPYSGTKIAYESVLRSGMADFGDALTEKDVTEYVLHLSSHSPTTPILVEFIGIRNPSEGSIGILGSKTLATPRIQNLIPAYFMFHNIQDVITVDGVDNPLRIAARTWRVGGIGSRSFIRK